MSEQQTEQEYVRVTKGQHDGQIGVVEENKRGWLTVRLADDTATKVRRSHTEPTTGHEEATEDAPEDEDELTPGKRMSAQLRKARVRYVTAKSYSGGASAHNNDDLAQALSGCDPKEVCELADAVLEHIREEPKHCVTRYAHLNKGQQRMNAGNLIRGRIKRGDIAVDEVLEILAQEGI